MSLQDDEAKNNETTKRNSIISKKCSNERRRKPPWDPCCSKLNHLIICKDCGCAYRENEQARKDEDKLRLVDFCGYCGKNCSDMLFSINLEALTQYQSQTSCKFPCDCQICRRCRPLALGDHYPDCECTLCERRALKCPNRDYYKMKRLVECDEENEGDENCPGFSRYCAPKEKKGIMCDCHDRTRIMRALHGAKCTCTRCIHYRMESRKCCEELTRTNARRFPKRRVNKSVDEMFSSTINSNFFPSVPSSCGHGPLCTCPSLYMATAAGIQTYMRDDLKPCPCHTYAPSHWERKAPCDFRMCAPPGSKPIHKPAWDISREFAENPDTKDSALVVGSNSMNQSEHKALRSEKFNRTMASNVTAKASKTGVRKKRLAPIFHSPMRPAGNQNSESKPARETDPPSIAPLTIVKDSQGPTTSSEAQNQNTIKTPVERKTSDSSSSILELDKDKDG